jgi:hypothetical protein
MTAPENAGDAEALRRALDAVVPGGAPVRDYLDISAADAKEIGDAL